MFAEKTVQQFVDELASRAPVPGGGSAAALAGALGAALVSMVTNLTIGKRAFRDVEDDLRDLRTQSEALRARILDLMEQDTQVYGQVMAAYRLPKSTEAEKAAQAEAYQQALQAATIVPIELAEACSQALDLALPAAEMGNRWAVSDAGVAALLAEACIHGALLNAEINTKSITNAEFLDAANTRIDKATIASAERRDRVMAVVRERMGA